MFNQTDRIDHVPVTLTEWQSSAERNDTRNYETIFELSADEDAQRDYVAHLDPYIVRYSASRDGS